jgi:AcrR family transcriptional regulator
VSILETRLHTEGRSTQQAARCFFARDGCKPVLLCGRRSHFSGAGGVLVHKNDRPWNRYDPLTFRDNKNRLVDESVAQPEPEETTWRDTRVAKGTLYLYFDSKDTLFAALAERLCAEVLKNAEAAVASSASVTQKLVGCLDAYIGSTHRLVAQSPHTAELTESKETLAAAIHSALQRKMKDLLRTLLCGAGIERTDAAEMLFAAAIGTLKTGDSAAKPYRARLTAVTEIPLEGLKHHRPRHDS